MADDKSGFDLFDLWSVDTASSTDDGCPTPSTTMSEGMPIREEEEETLKKYNDLFDSKPNRIDVTPSLDNHAHHIEHLPIPGRPCMIRTREKPHRILSLKYGKLEFQDHLSPAWGAYWSCSERGNFLYFRNTTSGAYLGYLTPGVFRENLTYGEAGKIVTSKECPEAKLNFVAIRQQGGGFILHTLHSQITELRQVAAKEDKNGIFPREQEKGGTPLDFIDAKYVRYSVSLAIPDMEREVLLCQE